MHEITDLLRCWNSGDEQALDRLIPLVDKELKKIAHGRMRKENPEHILQTTALVNEALIKLIPDNISFKNRKHFYVLVAKRMRQVLIDYARKAPPAEFTDIEGQFIPEKQRPKEILRLDEALTEFAKDYKRAAAVVECRHFIGLTIKEVAEVLDIAPKTVERDWEFALGWLNKYMTGESRILMPGDFDFRNLTAEVRQHMIAEIDQDIADNVLVKSARFTDDGVTRYPPLLRSAATEYNEAWLAKSLLGSFNATELSAGKIKSVPRNANTVFAQGEFNRFYCRAICLYALANPDHIIRVYRARQSNNPRPESEAKLGKILNAATVLKDLRTRLATDVEFGPNEVNSGLSLELVHNANTV